MTREQFAKQFTSPLPNAILKKFPDGNLRQYWSENPNLYSSAFGHNSMYQQYCCGHSGIDIATFHRDAVVSAHDGYVHAVKLDRETLGGICVWIRSPHFENGEGYVITAYGHLDECVVKTGDEIKAGQLIGYEGNTGFVVSGSTQYWGNAPAGVGTHLHFGVVEYLASGEPRYPNCMMNTSDPMLYITYKNPDYSGIKILLSNMVTYLKLLLERSK